MTRKKKNWKDEMIKIENDIKKRHQRTHERTRQMEMELEKHEKELAALKKKRARGRK